jgi:two-component sensor histidine kinase
MEQSSNFIEMMLAFFILGYILYEFMGFNQDSEDAYRRANEHLQDQNQTIIHQNEQNIVLLKEIHHRVKNNLQIIVSLLRLQKHELASEEAKIQFQEAINRVIVMSSIHQKLYRQDDFLQINLPEHLNELINEVKILFDNEKNIVINVDCKVKHIDLKSMVPLGLLINELLSNTFKYAFTSRKEGRIDIQISPSERGFLLNFEDNGLWNPESKNSGFGLELIEVFTNQLNGIRHFETDSNGTRYQFDLEFAETDGNI